MVAQAYNPRTRESVARGSGVQGHPLLYGQLWVILDLYEILFKTNNKIPVGKVPSVSQYQRHKLHSRNKYGQGLWEGRLRVGHKLTFVQ